jgi:hypothetical protein
VIPYREEQTKRHLKVSGDLGKVIFIVCRNYYFCFHSRCSYILQEYDLRNTQSIEESVRHSDIVFNLVGRDYPTKYAVDFLNTWLELITKGTFHTPMFISKEPKELLMRLPNMTVTGSYTFLHTTQILNRLLNFLLPRQAQQ